jgi:MinD-like ATPase involved in chromosome partitioning or flagellar assembly
VDERGGATGPEPGGRPLTRRELRARAAGASSGPAGEPRDPDPVDPVDPAERTGPSEADAWEAAVGWALRGEMPAYLPPEPPEPDDVRWDLPPVPRQPDGPHAVGHTGPEGPEVPDVDALARGLEPRRLPDAPLEDRRPWQDSGLWGAADADDGRPRRVSVFGAAPPEPDDAATAFVDTGAVAEAAASPDGADDGASGDAHLPTLDDLLASRPAPADGPAERGWRAVVRRATGGLIAPGPGEAERAERAWVASVQRTLDGPRTIVVVNPKGGAHKTTATLLVAATFGRLRGGYTLAWDNNETRGTLGWRTRHGHHARTAVDLLEDLERFADPDSSRVGDLDAYVRSQASAQFDVLASDEDAASAASIDAFAFRALHRTLLRFYRILVVDTGNNMRASNWQAALEAADQVVVVSTMREDTAQSAAWMLDALRATGHEDAVRRAVTVLSQPSPRIDAELTARLHDHFGRLTRSVLEVPYEPALVSGAPIDVEDLSAATRRAWLRVTAEIAAGL